MSRGAAHRMRKTPTARQAFLIAPEIDCSSGDSPVARVISPPSCAVPDSRPLAITKIACSSRHQAPKPFRLSIMAPYRSYPYGPLSFLSVDAVCQCRELGTPVEGPRLEVGAHTAAQILGLDHVEDLACLVAHQVHPRPARQCIELYPQGIVRLIGQSGLPQIMAGVFFLIL